MNYKKELKSIIYTSSCVFLGCVIGGAVIPYLMINDKTLVTTSTTILKIIAWFIGVLLFGTLKFIYKVLTDKEKG